MYRPAQPLIARVFTVLGAAALLGAGAPAFAAEPPGAPMLRVEAGMHVNVVRAVATDASGRWAVTASDDKTARVWDVLAAAPGPVLRVPIGDGAEGRLQAVVMSADGSTVAVAGNTGRAWDGNSSIYIFDRASGALLRRIGTGVHRVRGELESCRHLARRDFSPPLGTTPAALAQRRRCLPAAAGECVLCASPRSA